MNCFYHPSAPAVGLCKNCSRGLCPDCAGDQGQGLACKNRCEAEVEALWQIVQRGKSAYQKTAGAYFRVALFSALMGILFLGFPYFFPDVPPTLTYLFTGFALILFLGTAFNVFNGWRMKKL
ncbi:MAG TPA: hypothetical protein VJR29_03980 [bacterium]|nr:hypothetical protein [bacterium]